MEIEQLAEEKEVRRFTQGFELVKAGLTNREVMDKLSQNPQDLERFKNIGRQALQGLGQDPSLIDLLEPEAVEPPAGTRRNAFVNGKIVPAIENDQGQLLDPATGERMTNATIAPTRATEGGPGAFGNDITAGNESKLILETAQERTDQENFTAGINQAIDFYKSENFVGGITGKVLQGFNSALQQASQAIGKKDPLIKGGKLSLETLDADLSAENVSFMRKAAISGDIRDSAVMRLSFILAKRLNQDGKISDADVKLARDILSGSADQASAVLQLENVRDLSNAEFNRSVKNRAEALGKTDDPRFRPIPTGRGDSGKPVGEMTVDELFDI